MKLRIGIICPYDYFRHGGVQEHVRAVAEELRSRGHYVKVIAPTTTSGFKANDSNVILIGAATKLNTPLATTTEVTISATPRDIDDMFEKEKFDVLHAHEPTAPLLSKQILSRSSTKNVATFHARLPDKFINKSIEKAWYPYAKAVLKNIDAITAVSDAASNLIGTITKKDINIVPNGIQLKKFSYSKVKKYKEFDDDTPTILYIGRLEKRKGVEYLVKAYKKLSEDDKNIRLIIAGDGPKMKSLKATVKKHKLQNVHFLGFVTEEDKYSLLKTCDVYSSPALYGESFGIVLLEAMIMKAAIVAGNNPGYSSVMKGRGSIGIVDPRDTEEYARKLSSFLYDKQLHKLFTDWSDEYVKQFDYSIVTDSYEKLYKEILNK